MQILTVCRQFLVCLVTCGQSYIKRTECIRRKPPWNPSRSTTGYRMTRVVGNQCLLLFNYHSEQYYHSHPNYCWQVPFLSMPVFLLDDSFFILLAMANASIMIETITCRTTCRQRYHAKLIVTILYPASFQSPSISFSPCTYLQETNFRMKQGMFLQLTKTKTEMHFSMAYFILVIKTKIN